MEKTFRIGDKEYNFDSLSETGKVKLSGLAFVMERIQELNNHQAVLQRARNSYGESLKKEMLSDKAGLSFDDN